jgi:hypothetical protein
VKKDIFSIAHIIYQFDQPILSVPHLVSLERRTSQGFLTANITDRRDRDHL